METLLQASAVLDTLSYRTHEFGDLDVDQARKPERSSVRLFRGAWRWRLEGKGDSPLFAHASCSLPADA